MFVQFTLIGIMEKYHKHITQKSEHKKTAHNNTDDKITDYIYSLECNY